MATYKILFENNTAVTAIPQPTIEGATGNSIKFASEGGRRTIKSIQVDARNSKQALKMANELVLNTFRTVLN
jgi:hypothetical protein